MPDATYTLLVDGTPASAELLAAIQQIEVEDHADMADMLRLRLATGVREDGSGWTVLDDGTFGRLTNVKVLVTVGSGPAEALIDAYVMEVSAILSNAPGESTLNVVAMDATALMNLEEKVRSWPDMADSDIAGVIFGDYGFTSTVEQTQPVRQQVDRTTIQRDTDIRFLKRLARRNGFECYVETDPLTGLNAGYFRLPQLQQSPQGVLSIGMGEVTTVNSFNARFDMLRPATAEGSDIDVATQNDQSAQIARPSLPDLGKEGTLPSDRPRRLLLAHAGVGDAGELQTIAQAVVDRSAFAITAEGELSTAAYGRLLRAKRPVLVRGAGRQLSGTYYVERVLHTFTGEGYAQRFMLRRNALGLTGRESFVATNALSA